MSRPRIGNAVMDHGMPVSRIRIASLNTAFYVERSRRRISVAQHEGRPAVLSSVASSAELKLVLSKKDICLTAHYKYSMYENGLLLQPMVMLRGSARRLQEAMSFF